jgi:hypothetical protein
MSDRLRVCWEVTTISFSSASWLPMPLVSATWAGSDATVASLSL